MRSKPISTFVAISLALAACAGGAAPTPAPEGDPVITEFALAAASTRGEGDGLVTEIRDEAGALLATARWDSVAREGLVSAGGESLVVTAGEDELTPEGANAMTYDVWARTQPEVPYDAQCGVTWGWCENCYYCSDCFPSETGYDCIVYGWCTWWNTSCWNT